MPIHSAIFRQPGPELNPMRARVPTPIAVEVFPIEKKGRMTTLTGQWTAREATTKSVFERVGRQNDPYQARYLVASLFMMQTGIWHIDGAPEPYGSGYHFHLDPAAPSLCGSKFHCAESPSLALPLPEIRAGRRVLVPGEWAKLCEVCQRLLTHAPQPGDKVRVRVSGQTASIISVADPNLKPGAVERFILHYDNPATRQTDPGIVTASEIALTMFEKDQGF